MASAKRLIRLRAGIERCPLIKPYDLSFATLTSYDSVWVSALGEDQRLGVGEAVPLPGYNWETLDSIEATIKVLVAEGDAKPHSEIVEHCRAVRADHPFAASAVMAALDLPDHLGHAQSGKRFALSASVAGEWPIDELRRAVEAGLAAGFSYFKMKVGRYLDRDIEAARCILNGWPQQRYGVVFDANQAYSTPAAIEFARELQACDSRHLQWFEQPIDRQDWDGMEKVCRTRLTPVVLDECIYDEADIVRAKRIGAYGIKLKLFKNFGINETLALARHARELGLVVVFGNGVATDVGNLGEYLTLSAGGDLFAAPTECGGFARLRKPLLGPLLSVDGKGQMTFTGDGAALPSRLADFCVQTTA